MTPTLRKYHRHIWFFLAGFLPVLLVAAIVVLPEKSISTKPVERKPDALPEILKTADSELFTATLRGDANTSERQLEIALKRPLTSASALVYLTAQENADPKEGTLVGSLSSQQTYRFKAGEGLSGQEYVLLFDPIKHAIIESLKL